MKHTEKPFSPSCERNQEAILAVLKEQWRKQDQWVLELGSGTGQHAVFFAEHFPSIIWQTADLKRNHNGINMWLNEASLTNTRAPVEYQAGQSLWPDVKIDVVFIANTLHIMSFELVEILINDLGHNLSKGNRVMFYGPFKYQGAFTSTSNAEFDLWLKDNDTESGIRDFEVINQLMALQSIQLVKDIKMPANNQLLVYQKT